MKSYNTASHFLKKFMVFKAWRLVEVMQLWCSLVEYLDRLLLFRNGLIIYFLLYRIPEQI